MSAAKRLFGIPGATGCTVIGTSEAPNLVLDWDHAAFTTVRSSNQATFALPNLPAVETSPPSCAAGEEQVCQLFSR